MEGTLSWERPTDLEVLLVRFTSESTGRLATLALVSESVTSHSKPAAVAAVVTLLGSMEPLLSKYYRVTVTDMLKVEVHRASRASAVVL